jgi:ABC-2 type transport system permease protein
MIGLITATTLLSMQDQEKEKVIYVIDYTGEYFPVLQNSPQCRFVDEPVSSPYAHLIITGDLIENPKAISLLSEKYITEKVENNINHQLNTYLSNKKLSSYNIPNLEKILSESKIRINLKAEKFNKDDNQTIQGKSAEDIKPASPSAEASSLFSMVFSVLIYAFIMIYGGIVMQGVMEEKTNRIVEIIVSSVKPFDLMIGKLIGIGLVGLTQFAIWAGFIALLFSGAGILGYAPAIENVYALFAGIDIAKLLLFFIIFFIGGYMIYASLFAAIGAIVNSPEDSQQYMAPITILIMFAFIVGSASARLPDSSLAFWTSLIPFTAPIVMMSRIPFDVPLWELLLSIVLLFSTAIITLAVVAKIYRVGILMYGKKPTWGDIVKWLKY